ncbi:MAG: transglutaminase-like domain-containing protein [Elusimicrobiota bacterium]|jgi:regulator of sirC expression with transglutaminase-like and TPR domain
MTPTAEAVLDDASLRALLSLLDEEQDSSRELVESRVRGLLDRSAGRVDALRSGLSEQAAFRLGELLEEHRWNGLQLRLRALDASADSYLESALTILSSFADPALPAGAIGARLDEWAKELSWAQTPRTEPVAVLHRVNDFLFLRCGLRGEAVDGHRPDGWSLHKVLESRRGAPLMLAAVYLLIGRRIGLGLNGLIVPGHWLLSYDGSRQRLYVDACHGGRILNAADCEAEVQRRGLRLEPWQLLPVQHSTLFSRAVSGMAGAYARQGDRRRSERLAGLRPLSSA